MNDFVKRPNVTAATRGETQSGATGDKIPGFDPAAAPLETDSEAGMSEHVAPVPGSAARPDAPEAMASTRQNAPSDGDAMRRFDTPRRRGQGMMATVMIVAALVLVLAAFLLAR